MKQNSATETESTSAPILRRTPSQSRAQEKIRRIAECATALIAAKGSDSLKMSEIAQQASISIGALYQYFPDKSALIRYLFESCNAQSRQCIEEGLAAAHSADELIVAFNALIDEYLALMRQEPAMCDIWSATQTDKSLSKLEIAESRQNGQLLADTIRRIAPGKVSAQLDETAFLLMHFGESTMRIAVDVSEEESMTLIEAYKVMATRSLRDLLAG
ncbi:MULTISPECIES: TetR/AcrR family transcriptional regulator [Brucella/Ochrobactrum group]|uniref:Transcriptional regulator, TetR family n=1 Tax=Brucella anthropi (strain ATCC 49188 / DSM 6882 / CCUG 24695 / JCM 21032 / LMG 3331 / NBRC 15819 / NCTC 12168 / Alc 37) TaxID=439375 RepID=A6WZI5_BRUA4|nr:MULTISPECIES: TetR/AcrR family transcriptional regulator [Brucella/Ochrobactrum group]ABS14389.1 transcriptional regulator, TetR family [Brucella anthropi ATCC 49188]AIK44616.1 bacterial regulatory s, tetR family protein [Brucella anthropi]KAB2731889.1 TetR/AcrR family transcriptional regulator [Brucella anthropi]KAB2753407.1 TetR/AcrR family transcriptional regulator [Brucella anthropi]KAB2760984.1 TetR/AcrR family transcriptional regulator [Brucella anthropi]